MRDPLKFGILVCGKTPHELSHSLLCADELSGFLKLRGYVPSGYHTSLTQKVDRGGVKMCTEKLYYLSRVSDLVFTVGADGFANDDIIPEITSKICSCEANYFTCILCGHIPGLSKKDYSPTRSRAGVCAGALVLNLRCDKEFISDTLPFLLPKIESAVTEISGKDADKSRAIYDKMVSLCDVGQISLNLAEI